MPLSSIVVVSEQRRMLRHHPSRTITTRRAKRFFEYGLKVCDICDVWFKGHRCAVVR